MYNEHVDKNIYMELVSQSTFGIEVAQSISNLLNFIYTCWLSFVKILLKEHGKTNHRPLSSMVIIKVSLSGTTRGFMVIIKSKCTWGKALCYTQVKFFFVISNENDN